MKNYLFIVFSFPLLLLSCIGDDFVDDKVDPVLRITNSVDTLGFGDTYQFKAQYLNNVGMEEMASIIWTSSDESIITIDNTGLATAGQMGQATIRVELNVNNTILSDELVVNVSEETVVTPTIRMGSLQTTSSYTLTGNFTLANEDGTLVLSFDESYAASSNLPGLYIYLTNNPSTTNGALELGKVETFSGAHTYTIPSNVTLNEFQYVLYFCKPFNVKVGDGEFEN